VIAVITREKIALPDGVRVISPKEPEEMPIFSKRRFYSSERVIDKALAELRNRFTTKDLSASEEQAGTKSTKESKGLCID